MSKSWILALLCGLTMALLLVFSLSEGVIASFKVENQPIGSKDESIVNQQMTGTMVSQPVPPVDTSDLPPAPLLPTVVETALALEHNLPLTNALRAASELPTNDPLVQKQPGQENMPAPEKNWEGIPATGVFPPDTDGQVGRDHYVQIVNTSGQGSQIRVWDKNGNQLYNFGFNSMYPSSGTGSRCYQYGYGDPVVLYDQMADRWILTQFTNPPSAPYNECIAISKTSVPTNNPSDWWLYEFNVHSTKFNDYPKFGIWPDGYYMTANQFIGGSLWGGAGVWVFNRTSMLSGGATSFIYFDLYNLNPNLGGLLPSNLMGNRLPPNGAPNYLMSVDMDWSGSGTPDVMHLFEVHTDWGNPSSSTLTWIKDMEVAPFDWNFANSGADVPQPSTSQGLDGLADRLMMHLWYRNLGSHEALVVNHTVDAGGDLHGIRWYEIRGGNVNTSLVDAFIYQQGTYAPDSHHRWMGSIAMDHVGNIALGYSVASSTLYPSIRYSGRMVNDPLNMLPQSEVEIIAGSGSQTGRDSYGRGRWGDYSAMSVDPVDDCTFWYTQEYIQTTSLAGWRTRVAAFRFPNCTSGESGRLVGMVSDASTSLPLSGAEIRATDGLTVTASTTTHPNGSYTLTLPVSVYTVTALRYGYIPDVVSGVSILANSDHVQDFSLSPATLYQVEGVIRDATTGWPLYAKILVEGTPLEPFWSDPVTGYYSVTLPGGSPYTFSVDAFAQGYLPIQQVVGSFSANLLQDIYLQADLVACQAPGYGVNGFSQNFEDGVPPSGWEVRDQQGNSIIWQSCSSWSVGNFTDGAGECAAVVSRAARFKAYDTELRTPLFDSAVIFTKTLTFRANYQDHSLGDYFNVDVTNNNGMTWGNVLHWTSDHGAKQSTPGELMTIDLAPYLSGSNNRIRWRYANPSLGAWDEYIEIDEVRVGSTVCSPQPGGLVVGIVFDLNTSIPLIGATVSNEDGYSTITLPTPEDIKVKDGFYTLFSPAGTRSFTTTMTGGYSADVEQIDVVPFDVVLHDFHLPAGKLQVTPTSIERTVQFAQQMTVPVTLTNLGGAPLSFEIVDINQGFTPLGSMQYAQVTIPETTYLLNDHTTQKYRHRPPYLRPEISFQVPEFSNVTGYINVLLLTPDLSAGGDINLITTTLTAFGDINLSIWDTDQGDPEVSDLSPYDVVIIGNDYRWSTVGLAALGVGNALADYVDGGGKVIDSMFVHDWAGWELGGRYITGQYSPFTASTSDFELVPYNLGTVYQPSHPVMQGVVTITDDPSIGIGHQDVGLSDGALRLADWEDGQVYVALKGNVAGINQLWFHGANWLGDVPVLMHNLIRFLAVQDAGWLTENPGSGNLSALSQQVVWITLNSADASSGRRGLYLAELVTTNDTPYGALSIPVVMTVTVPFENFLPLLSNNQP